MAAVWRACHTRSWPSGGDISYAGSNREGSRALTSTSKFLDENGAQPPCDYRVITDIQDQTVTVLGVRIGH